MKVRLLVGVSGILSVMACHGQYLTHICILDFVPEGQLYTRLGRFSKSDLVCWMRVLYTLPVGVDVSLEA